MAVDYLGQRSFDVAVLPARVGYLIKPRSAAGFRRAVQEACTRWGGITELIIPVRAGGRVDALWREYVRFAKLQGLVNVDASAVDAQSAGVGLGLGVTDLRDIENGDVRFTSHPSFVARLPEYVSSLVIAEAGEPPPLWQVAAAGT